MEIDRSSIYLSMSPVYALDELLVQISLGTLIINTADDDIEVFTYTCEQFALTLDSNSLLA
jgi:hypothetical protein